MYLHKLFLFIIVTLIILLIFVAAADIWVSIQARGRIFDSIQKIPSRNIALVLGTSKYIGKNLNPYYTYRIEAAKELYQNNKVNVLLLSGDNEHLSYNEPWTMKRDMLRAGIPNSRIYLDYAGFRTLDSVIRAKKIFDANAFTLVTQAFHCERALFITEHYDIDAICLAAPSPKGLAGLKIRVRETVARVKAILDIYILNVQPRFLGPKESICINVIQTNSRFKK
ncbi:SanA/YdcF family protein [Candidatus Enterovibrio escicola]|uniref:SanA protein n=1 Tax=Candidatus Enterovibrio escicola TaxID=1927127 RepID=A0A2A5T2M1_9GAMM|nr:ElyC/SanA/YdcF family protein [Candidatus Enterovibrio escacola]PCS22380.1 SanA protein [Candidatus Enterovibrio escacola]